MDDLSIRAVKLVIEYCLEVLEEVAAKISGRPSIARLEAALNGQYASQPDISFASRGIALCDSISRTRFTISSTVFLLISSCSAINYFSPPPLISIRWLMPLVPSNLKSFPAER